MLIQMAISRSREFLADEGGARLCHDPEPLAMALEKLEVANQKMPMLVNPATENMFRVRQRIKMSPLIMSFPDSKSKPQNFPKCNITASMWVPFVKPF